MFSTIIYLSSSDTNSTHPVTRKGLLSMEAATHQRIEGCSAPAVT